MYKQFFKVLVDFFLALFLLALLIPVMFLIVILLSFSLKGSPFFIQKRPGKNGKLFFLVKFKTMNDNCDSTGSLLPDKDRITNLGRFVRKTSLDELPQLINVLKGEMSFVGPRPLLVEYLLLYSEEQYRRHLVKPGITGWAQINGRNKVSWEDKFKLDVWYVENLSFILDVKIMILTILRVLKSDGISSNTSVTMEKFKGSK